MYDFEKQ
jgi:hypothetical protein